MLIPHSTTSASAYDTSPQNFVVFIDVAKHLPVESLIIASKPKHCLLVSVVVSTLIFTHPQGGRVQTFGFFFCIISEFSSSRNFVLLKPSLTASALVITRIGSNFNP